MRLYEIGAAYRGALLALEEARAAEVILPDGEIVLGATAQAEADLLHAAFDAIGDAFDQKAESIAMLMRELDAEAEAVKAEEARLSRRRKALESHAARLKDYLRACFVSAGRDKLKTGLFSFSIGKPRASVQVVDLEAIPEDLLRVVPETREPDKIAIKKALDSGREVPGVCLVEGSASLTVR
jgi:hypothetical protein